jgi:hypothetical protein
MNDRPGEEDMMKKLILVLLAACLILALGLLMAQLTGCATLPDTSSGPSSHVAPTQERTVVDGTLMVPAFVEDIEAGASMRWHISINGGKAVDWCAGLMPGRKAGEDILLSSNAMGTQHNEYRITRIDPAQRSVSVAFV